MPAMDIPIHGRCDKNQLDTPEAFDEMISVLNSRLSPCATFETNRRHAQAMMPRLDQRRTIDVSAVDSTYTIGQVTAKGVSAK